jgi:hypothetical protein
VAKPKSKNKPAAKPKARPAAKALKAKAKPAASPKAQKGAKAAPKASAAKAKPAPKAAKAARPAPKAAAKPTKAPRAPAPAKAPAAPAKPAKPQGATLPATLVGMLPSMEKVGHVTLAAHAAGFLVGYQGQGVSPFRVRAIYGADRLGAVHEGHLMASAFSVGVRPTAPDGHGFAALVAWEDELGEIFACPLSFDGLLLPAHVSALSAGHTIAADPVVAASGEHFWVAYQLSSGSSVEVFALRRDGGREAQSNVLHATEAGTQGAHRRPHLAAAHGGVGVTFTVGTAGHAGGVYFAFIDEHGLQSPLCHVSEHQGDARIARAGGGFVVTVARVDGTFDVVRVSSTGPRDQDWTATTVGHEIEGHPIGLAHDEVVTVGKDRTALVRYTHDGKTIARHALAHPANVAAHGHAGWLVAGAEGSSAWVTHLPR